MFEINYSQLMQYEILEKLVTYIMEQVTKSVNQIRPLELNEGIIVKNLLCVTITVFSSSRVFNLLRAWQ